ncbi:hypothetical protein P9C27_20025 [Bacillus vallismortis]|nr:hypothetical protein [Bacillus vallismortis]
MQFHQIQNGKQTNHLKWLGAIFFSWGTFVFALFFATFVGSMARQAGASKLLQQGIQAGLVTFITVPLLYILLKRTSSRPFCSIGLSGWRQAIPKAIMGALYVIFLSGTGFTIAHLLGLITITQFHFSGHLVTVLLLNMIIAFFYEAFPEELTFRGTMYNALNGRFISLTSAADPICACTNSCMWFAVYSRNRITSYHIRLHRFIVIFWFHSSTSAYCNRKLMDIYRLSSGFSRKFSFFRRAGG